MTKFFKNLWVIFFILLSFMEPDCIIDNARSSNEIVNLLHPLFLSIKYLPFLCAFFMFPYIGRPSKMLLLIVIYMSIIFLSSYVNGNLSKTFIFVSLLTVSLCVITEFYVKNNYYVEFFSVFSFFLYVYIILNFLSIIIFPEGIYEDERGWSENYFLGFKNRHFFYFLPFLFFVFLKHFFLFGKIKRSYYVALFLVLLSSLLNGSTTCLISSVVFTLFFLFLKEKYLPRWANVKLILFLLTICSIVVVVGTLVGDLLQYSEVVSEFSGKKTDSVANRGIIWVEAIISLSHHPLMGVGDVIIDIGDGLEYGQFHNHILDILAIGGILLYFVFCLQFFFIFKKMKLLKTSIIYNVLLFVFIAYSIEYLQEGKRNNYIWNMILVIIYYMPNLIDKNKNRIMRKTHTILSGNVNTSQ